jgi:hypothetical protein
MEKLIKQWHTTTGVMAYGGEDQMTRERWLRIDAKIESELEFLQAFQEEMAGQAEITDGLISRASMYADAPYGTYENNVMAREFDAGVRMGRRVCEEDTASCEECVEAASTYFSELADIPEIGTLQCLGNCRCFIEYAEPITGLGVEHLSAEFQSALQQADAVQ